MKRFAALLGLLFCAFGLSAQKAEENTVPPGKYIIGGIVVEGVQFTDKQSIITLSGLNVGQELEVPGSLVNDALQKLWKQKVFSDVEIKAENIVGNKIYLSITLSERPRISKYRFKGITKSQADELREKVRFISGAILNESKKRSAIRTVKNYYQEKGFLNVNVEVKTEPDPNMPNGQIVTLEIKKGLPVRIRKIIFEGNEEVVSRRLRYKMKDTKQMADLRLWKRSKFIRSNFNDDKKRIADLYSAKGYRDFKFVSDTLINVDKRKVDLVIQVFEGQKYYIRNIDFVGNQKYSSKELQRMLNIKKGQVYNAQLLERRLLMDPNGSDISSLYLDDGYLFFRAEPVEVRVVGDSIDVEVRIFEGQQATYGKIILEGNTKTSDHVILREIRTLPGNKFSRSELIRSQREILNLGYFNQESMNVIPMPDPAKGTVDIKYIVEEKPSDQVFFQGGWGGQVRDAQGRIISNGLVLTVGLTFTNFSTRKFFKRKAWKPVPTGDGQRVSISIQTSGLAFQNYGISFVEPWLGGKKPLSFGISVNYSTTRSLVTDYYFGRFNASIDIGTRMKFPDDFFRSQTTLNYDNYDVRNASAVFGGFNTGQINILSLRQVFDRTSIDAPIYPRSGSILTLTMEATPPWSLMLNRQYEVGDSRRFELLEYWKIKFDAQVFLTLIRWKLPLVLAPRFRMGLMGSYNPNYTSPFQRFYLGGDGLQGWSLDGREIMALRGYGPTPGIGTGATFGNVAFTKMSIELRQPITLSPQSTIWVHAFFEMGNAWSRIDEINPFQLKRSTGFGVRLFLPMFGLLGFDYAFGLDDAWYQATPGTQPINLRYNNPGGFHFMIGQQF